MLRSLESAISTKKLGWPAGGNVLPSRSEGNRLAMLGGFWKQIKVAELPASMAARFKGARLRSQEAKCPPRRSERVRRVIVGVRPDAEFGIVGEVSSEIEFVPVVPAGGI